MKAPVVARAYGRVNLIGEHTDYNGGWVLPTAIPQYTEVKLRSREDLTVRAFAPPDPASGERREQSYRLGEEAPRGEWIDYIQGATKILGREKLRGFDLEIVSRVPEGSGLSSSAALEVSLLKALRGAFSLPLADLELARLGQRIENEFVGAKVGIMDQVACTLARAGEALFLDTLTLSFERIAIPPDRVELLVMNSGISHRNAGGGYNERRAECEEAARRLGLGSLRELEEWRLAESLPPALRKRARHVFTENERVHRAARALAEEDFSLLGKLFLESHESMRSDYEVSLPEIDFLVRTLAGIPGVYGARLTGGGFGGCVVALTRPGRGREAASIAGARYEKETGRAATLLVPEAQ